MRTQDSQHRTFHEADSEWLRSFSLQEVKRLVVCRGPVRKEAFDVFDEIGIREYGMLLSEKDSVVYPRCMAPEMRSLRFPSNIHRVPVTSDGKLLGIITSLELVCLIADGRVAPA